METLCPRRLKNGGLFFRKSKRSFAHNEGYAVLLFQRKMIWLGNDGNLEVIFLILALGRLFLIGSRLQLFHQITTPVTVHPWPALVYTKPLGNVLLVQIKTRLNKILRKMGAK